MVISCKRGGEEKAPEDSEIRGKEIFGYVLPESKSLRTVNTITEY